MSGFHYSFLYTKLNKRKVNILADYNSGRTYNKKIYEGGANYNSGPFTIYVLDSGTGSDFISCMASVPVNDIGVSNENISQTAFIALVDQSLASEDSIAINGNVSITDHASGADVVNSIKATVPVSDSGIGHDEVKIAGAFFVIDSNSILQPLGVLVSRDSRYELLPATRDSTDEIPGRHGEFDFGSEFKPRYIELHVNTGEGYAPLEKAQLQRLFAKYLDPTKGAKTLIFSDDIEKTYRVKYSGQIDLTQYATWFEFTIPFKMSDPIIYGSFEKAMTGNGTLVNEGTSKAPLIIEIAGPVTNPSVTIGTDVFFYTGTISSGQKLIIDTEAETAILNGANVVGNVSGPLPYFIEPGYTPVTAGSTVTVRWHDRWI